MTSDSGRTSEAAALEEQASGGEKLAFRGVGVGKRKTSSSAVITMGGPSFVRFHDGELAALDVFGRG